MCCIYMPTDSACSSVIEDSYVKFTEDVLGFMQKGRVVLLGDFNARVGRSTDVDDVIGMFGEETCNASGNPTTYSSSIVTIRKPSVLVAVIRIRSCEQLS